MQRRWTLVALLLALALPLSASQFIQQPFDQVAREAQYIVRGELGQTWSAWDDAHEVIFTYATVRVTRYFGETTGPDTIVIREVGGTVDGYTQQAIGFPVLRSGEQVVVMLAKTDDGAAYRIHAYNQGKFIVRNRGGIEVLTEDPVKQGEERSIDPRQRIRTESDDEIVGLTIAEFAGMVEAARAGESVSMPSHRE
jgi:hypothetical protein